MKLILLFGDSAVGKMTVGQELTKITDLRLFHNHATVEPVLEVFGEFNYRVISALRYVVFEEFAASEQYGLIFTFMWAFDRPQCWVEVARIREIFELYGAEIYYVELTAPQEVRLQRNMSANRLKHKPSKRDVEASRERLLKNDENNRFVSEPGEIPFDNYLKIDNSSISAAEAARSIQEYFNL